MPPMLKIGQNWSKIANYPSNAQHKSAPLLKSVIFGVLGLLQFNVTYRSVDSAALLLLKKTDRA